MNSQNTEKKQIEISIIGSGIAGVTTAYHLGRKGYKINLIDPTLNSKINNLNPQNGTQASLGVLMGNIYKRSKGRAFMLRNKSMIMWKEWLYQINNYGLDLNINKPLIKLASSEKEYQSMIELFKNKKDYGIEFLDKKSLDFWNHIFETKLIGGLISHEDGRLNPIELLKALMENIEHMQINKINKNVVKIYKNNNIFYKKWNIKLKNDQPLINQDYIVICSSLNTQELLKPLGHEILLEPILGQVIELDIEDATSNWKEWPAILNYQSINFIYHNSNRMIMGATVENNNKPSLIDKQKMLSMNNVSPKWIKNAKVCHEWHGIRAKPINEPAPILRQFEPGLLVNAGHYRNGILLAPACAEWVRSQIEKE